MYVMIHNKCGWVIDTIEVLYNVRTSCATADDILTNAGQRIATVINAKRAELIDRKTLVTSRCQHSVMSQEVCSRPTHSTEIRWRKPGHAAVAFSAWKQFAVMFGHEGSEFRVSCSCCEITRMLQ